MDDATTRATTLDDLPDEALSAVLLRMPCAERIMSGLLVCRRWHRVLTDALNHGAVMCATRLDAVFRKSGTTLCDVAARNGHLDCLRRAVDRGSPFGKRTTQAAASGGSLACLRYLHERGCPWNRDTPQAAARKGHVDCLKYARENGCDWNFTTSEEAARKNHLDCLVYAHENGCDWGCAAAYAAASGHAACLEYVLAHSTGKRHERLRSARTAACLRVLARFGLDLANDDNLFDAAYSGDHDTVGYLLGRGVTPTLEICTMAVGAGNLDAIRWLVNVGRAWGADLCATAALNGQCKMLAYLRAHDYPWDARTCASAVQGDHVECLRYARENGCPCDASTWAAVRSDSLCMAYLVEHDRPRGLANALPDLGLPHGIRA